MTSDSTCPCVTGSLTLVQSGYGKSLAPAALLPMPTPTTPCKQTKKPFLFPFISPSLGVGSGLTQANTECAGLTSWPALARGLLFAPCHKEAQSHPFFRRDHSGLYPSITGECFSKNCGGCWFGTITPADFCHLSWFFPVSVAGVYRLLPFICCSYVGLRSCGGLLSTCHEGNAA